MGVFYFKEETMSFEQAVREGLDQSYQQGREHGRQLERGEICLALCKMDQFETARKLFPELMLKGAGK
jgi:flagellar biosynthesis/type III secretory pathway protein FliH